MSTKKERAEAERQEWREKLRGILKPGDTVLCVLRHVSRSGMQRRIDLYAPSCEPGGAPMFISGMAAAAMGERWDRDKGGIIVGGCGMDMGFHLVYNLGYVLWPDGFGCIGEKCPSNDHSNGDRDYTPHGCPEHNLVGPMPKERPEGVCDNGVWRDHWHSDGGYILRHRWL